MKRDRASYLLETLHSLFKSMSYSEKNETVVVVQIAEVY